MAAGGKIVHGNSAIPGSTLINKMSNIISHKLTQTDQKPIQSLHLPDATPIVSPYKRTPRAFDNFCYGGSGTKLRVELLQLHP
ncbi:hypothetical protein DPMN_112027 [Dreissena polymorpha]|uniref:Uncharacterized protein n=1 Tax=Dreissena polymorpha TaxID=45954 RepID=A0A9D4QPL8_DREPO|nr:hypothetical protein DPMN_112027 [Dreissena polymorpha]